MIARREYVSKYGNDNFTTKCEYVQKHITCFINMEEINFAMKPL